MPAHPADPLAPLPLAQFVADVRSLGEADFGARHGVAFLLHHGELDPSRKPIRPQQTIVMGRSDTPPPMPGPARRQSTAMRSLGGLLIYPVKHTGRSPFPRIVTVGRTKNNDIVLADISVSKFHAFFKEDDGQMYVSDGESRNGTFVDGERVLTTKQGKATSLKSGAQVKLGALEFRYIDVKELMALVRQLG